MDRGAIQHVGPPPARPAGSDSNRLFAWLFVGSSMFWPRLFIFGFWIFGSQLGRAFDAAIVPILGFVLLPWTTAAYALMWGISSDRVSGWEWIVVGIAVLADLVTWWTLVALRRSG